MAIRHRNKTGSGPITDTKGPLEYGPNTSIHLSDYALCRARVGGIELTAFGHCTKRQEHSLRPAFGKRAGARPARECDIYLAISDSSPADR